MKIVKKSLLLLSLILVSCSTGVEATSIRLESTVAITSLPATESLSSPTLTAEPASTDISCELVVNPTPAEMAEDHPYVPDAETYRVCTFTGKVSRGQSYKHPISPDLVFCLIPGGVSTDVPNEGWNIIISDTRPGGCDVNSEDYINFGPIVTPPFYGNLFFDVYGWHFRNEDNSGENDGSVYAPQEERYFNFLFNRRDYDTALLAVRCIRWKMDADCALATQNSMNAEIPTSLAKFTVTELELGNLVPGSHAWIETMEFRVDVYLPAE
jgi:hypothetical protein